MSRTLTRILASLVVVAAATLTLQAAKPARPNLILILVDDMGMPCVSAYGGVYKTPNIDKLAAGGIRFERCYASPLCAPSRALCMMGRYAFRTGVVDNPFGGKATPDKEICMAKPLKNAGYATAVVGKWRQLSKMSTKAEAAVWGFDEFMLWGTGDGEGGDRYWSKEYLNNGESIKIPEGTYGPDFLQEYMVDFIRRHKDQPFFIYYPMTMMHGGFAPTPDTKDQPRKDRAHLYADTITYLDKMIGRLVADLDKMHLREKTLILFTGDNGSVDSQTIHGRMVQGVKHELTEGGSRVPLIVNWKGTTPAGKVLPDLVDFTDFYVTFAELAGAKLPEGHKLDGHSFAPQLRGKKGSPREWMFMQLADRWYARSDKYKLYNDDQLFDMSDAPFGEKLIKAGTETAEAKAEREKLQAVLKQLDPGQLPVGPKFDHEAARQNAPKAKKQKAAPATEPQN